MSCKKEGKNIRSKRVFFFNEERALPVYQKYSITIRMTTDARVKRCSLSWEKASSSTLRQKKLDLRDFREENAPRTRGYILLISPGPDLNARVRSVMLDEACSATAAPHSLSTSIYGVHLAHNFQK